jgi:hypothetical protein
MSKRRTYETAGEEPDLQELLADPVILAVMQRDGVSHAELWAVIRTGRRLLGAHCDAPDCDAPNCDAGALPMLPRGWPVQRCQRDRGAASYAQ